MATYIGIDVGKKNLQVYFAATNKSFEVTNNHEGLSNLLKQLTITYSDLAGSIIVFEPTGGYERVLREFLKAHKISFTTAHPNKVRNYARAKGLLAKTDKIDSKLLCDYACSFSLPPKQSYESTCPDKSALPGSA